MNKQIEDAIKVFEANYKSEDIGAHVKACGAMNVIFDAYDNNPEVLNEYVDVKVISDSIVLFKIKSIESVFQRTKLSNGYCIIDSTIYPCNLESYVPKIHSKLGAMLNEPNQK